MSDVHLHIGHLVLEGLPVGAGDGPAVHAAIEAELTRLLGSSGAHAGLAAGGYRPVLQGGGIQLDGRCGAAGLGRQIARSVFGSIAGAPAADGPARTERIHHPTERTET